MAIKNLPTDGTGPTFPFGNGEVRKQLAQFDGDAKELINGSPLDSDDGGALENASVTASGGKTPSKGKTFTV